MRFWGPMPGTPWPVGMTISVHFPAAWLGRQGRVGSPVAPCLAPGADWYSVQEPDPTIHPEPGFIHALTQPGQGLNPLIPPFLQADHGWDGLDAAAFSAWERRCRPHHDGHTRTRFGNAGALPEPQSLPALTAAWEGGLDTVIVLPYAGYFARRVTPRHLAVSAATRNDPVRYSRALGTLPVTSGSEG